MARPKAELLLEAKLEEARQLEAEIRRLKNAARDKKRAADEQRERIAGRIVLAEIASHPESDLAQTMGRLLADKLTRPGERKWFPELPAMPPSRADASTDSPPEVV